MKDKNIQYINGSDVEFCGRIFLDRNFCTFRYNGEYFKALLPKVHNYNGVDLVNFFKSLSCKGFIPNTTASELRIKGLGQIFHQYTEHFNFHPKLSPVCSLQEAAFLWLKFNKFLATLGMGLADGHCSNIVFQGAMLPKWCDCGSIVSLCGEHPHLGIDEFIRFFIYPLQIREKNPALAEVSRSFTWRGVSHEVARAFALSPISLSLSREKALDELWDMVNSMSFVVQHSNWSDYYQDDFADLKENTNLRINMFCRIFRALHPATVVDIGANSGFFSRYMASTGAEVCAIEPDESAVLKHWTVLRRKNFSHNIKLMMADIRDSAGVQGELATALALTHHLFFTCHYPWKYIAELLSMFCTNSLLTEFMPNGLYVNIPDAPLPDNYRIELFAIQLERYFSSVEILPWSVPEGASPRIFLLCRNKRATPRDDGWGYLPQEILL